MEEIVRDYDDTNPDGVQRVGESIDGTAFFPGGDGLWRGAEPHGPSPRSFSENAVMFVGHNFDCVSGYQSSLERGIEIVRGVTWRNLRVYMQHAGLREGRVVPGSYARIPGPPDRRHR